MSNFIEVSVKKAIPLIEDKNTLLLDVRDIYSYKKGHIDGAMQAHGDLVQHLIQSKQYERPVLVYCYQGNSSKELAEVFSRAGFLECYSLMGGFAAWKKRNSLFSDTPYSDETNAWLIAKGFEEQSLNATIYHQNTPLILASQEGREDIVATLLQAGADTNQTNADSQTPLWAACYSQDVRIVKALINSGANIDHQNQDGVSALMYASSAGFNDVVQCLLEHGANTALNNVDGFSALDLAATPQIIKILRAKEPVSA